MTSSKWIKYTVLALSLFLLPAPQAHASQMSQIPKLMGRGLLNLVTSPLELLRTPVAEMQDHKYLWPFFWGPRAFRNFFYRAVSGAYDFVFYPFATPFVDETPPLTQKMGIANYIWQIEDDN